MSDPKAQIGRLAFRVEGDAWIAYYALPDTMDGAIVLGSVAMAVVERDDRKCAFMDFMRDVVGDIIEGKVGIRPSWGGPTPAPEHERAGRA